MTHQVTEESRRVVENAAGYGMKHAQICHLIGCSEKTLRKKYRVELDKGTAIAHFNVSKTCYQSAVAGNATLLIWYEKTRMGMRETLQVTTPSGEPIQSESNEAELIGAYYKRLAQAGIDAATAEARSAAGADPGVAEALDGRGQGSQRRQGDPPAHKG